MMKQIGRKKKGIKCMNLIDRFIIMNVEYPYFINQKDVFLKPNSEMEFQVDGEPPFYIKIRNIGGQPAIVNTNDYRKAEEWIEGLTITNEGYIWLNAPINLNDIRISIKCDMIVEDGKFGLWDDPLVQEAKKLSELAHRGQTRWSGEPYFTHPYAVATKVYLLGASYQTVALLHDVLEDTNYTVEMLLENGIPQDIIDDVKLLTRTKGESYSDYITNRDWSVRAIIIKLADLTHNLKTLKDGSMKEKYLLATHILKEKLNELIKKSGEQCEKKQIQNKSDKTSNKGIQEEI